MYMGVFVASKNKLVNSPSCINMHCIVSLIKETHHNQNS